MSGLYDHYRLLNQIQHYVKIAKTVSVTGLLLTDAAVTKGRVNIKFDCPDDRLPEYSFSAEFSVNRSFFDRHLKQMLKIDV